VFVAVCSSRNALMGCSEGISPIRKASKRLNVSVSSSKSILLNMIIHLLVKQSKMPPASRCLFSFILGGSPLTSFKSITRSYLYCTRIKQHKDVINRFHIVHLFYLGITFTREIMSSIKSCETALFLMAESMDLKDLWTAPD